MRNKGFFKIVVVVIIGVLLLAYFRVDIRGALDSLSQKPYVGPIAQTALGFAYWTWDNFLQVPTEYLYNQFMTIVWPTIQNQIDSFQNGPVSNPIDSANPADL